MVERSLSAPVTTHYFGQIVTNILDGKNIKLESIYGECKESSDTV